MKKRTSLGRATLACTGLLLLGLLACGGEAERAAQAARIDQLEQEVKKLSEAMGGGKPIGLPHSPNAIPDLPFLLTCPQPWHLHTPLGASLWTCRSHEATPEGLYAQCSVSLQPQVAIETKEYFTFALNSAVQLHQVANLKDKPTEINGATAFEATFDADVKPVSLRMLSALFPYNESTFAVTCFAPSAAFDRFVPGFRKIIDSFKFEKK